MKKVKHFITDAYSCTQNIRKETGKNSIIVFCDICWCAIVYGASPNNYDVFGFVNLRANKRRTYVTHRMSNKIIKANNNRAFYEILENKAVFNHTFAEHIKREYVKLGNKHEQKHNKNLRDFYFTVADDKKCIYKPIHGSRGEGIKVLEFGTIEELDDIVQKLNEDAILESWIRQEEHLNSIYPNAVSCVRVVSFLHNNEVNILSATITFSKGGVISNASCNDLECKVNEKSGVVITNAVDYSGAVYDVHPITRKRFKGVQIKKWDEVISLVDQAARIVPEIKYVGWDIAISEDGPVLIEGNATPGYKSLQIKGLCKDNIGLRDKYQIALR